MQEPLGQSLPNQEIFRRLARAMGIHGARTLYEPDEAILAHLLRGVSCVDGFDELKRRGTVFITDITDTPVLQFADLEFPTPSGRIELRPARAPRLTATRGSRRCRSPICARPWGRLRLLSPAAPWLMHFSFANEPGIHARLGAADIVLHPDRRRGYPEVKDGDLARVAGLETGEIVLPVRVSDEVRPGVALSCKGRWPRQESMQVNMPTC